ncbi:MAG: c-type cytochrome [Bacteroidetes bacterium]|nr:c-type cytochrome [Bacteroidota bacterium]MCW5896977.1 c-type cytochrome [Bacteroidota bacterium]
MFEQRAKIPIEQRNYSTYYLVLSGLLFLGTMWAVVDEVATRRPWKDYQKEYRTMADTLVKQQIEYAASEIDSFSLDEARKQLNDAQDSLRSDRYLATMKEFEDATEALIDETREYQFAKSRGDEAYYFWKKSIQEGKENLGLKARLDKEEALMAEHQEKMNLHQATKDSLQVILNEYRANVRTAQNAVANILKTVEKWETKQARLASAPIQIRQVMMLDYDRNPFNDPKARVDRCQSCHLGWNEELMEEVPQPFRKHPLPELLASHNPEVYGCTPCHRGQGAALTAGMAHGEDDHYWENPLLKGKDVWASCNECHDNESILRHAPTFTNAKRLMIESGCHGCHEIKGYTDVPKIGPQLTGLSYKTSPTWVYEWVKNPKAYNPHTRMPDFKFSETEAEAVTAYLMDVSQRYQFAFASPRGAYSGGNIQRGKETFETVGCQSCHVVGEMTAVREARGTSYDIAPELTRVGSKVSPDWMYDWIRNPKHFNPTTKMPSLRLTDAEARDVVAYLMTLKDEREISPETLDLTSSTTIRKGESLIREYGCNGCHLIPGFEKEGRVSVSLSNFGRKKVDEIDFGDTKVKHTWHDWVYNKLKNARAFATDRIVQKMPIFSFSDEEVITLRMYLLSLTKDEPDKKYVRAFDKKQQNIESGRRLAMLYNCQQCHMLEDHGSYLAATIEETAFHPPIITGEGAKVQEQWLHDFLKSPSPVGQNSVRPWVPTRMPTFQLSEDEINKLQKYFLGLSNQEFELRDYRAFPLDPQRLRIGKEIFTDFQCLNCHPSGPFRRGSGEVSTSDLAPNLALSRDRLKPEWIVEWLADPGKIQPGTRMPTFFPDGESPLPDVLEGDARKQMEAIRDYVLTLARPVRTTVVSK